MTLRRPLAALVVGLLALAALAGPAARPAAAHGGDALAEPIFETMTPTAAGIAIEVVYSANYQLLVRNTTPEPLTFLADSGEPFLEIGPGGVRGNFASPTFYDSNVPGGREFFPPEAKPGPDVPPNWRKLAAEPTWGWYDHRLHPADRTIPPEVLQANKLAVLGRWKIPIRLGDRPGEIHGRFEFRPATGTYSMAQTSSRTPAPGVRIETAPGRVVPAIFVENTSPDPVIVLGRANEPFARIGRLTGPDTRVTEVNVKSPTWVEVAQARGQDPSDEADPKAEPKWQQVATGPTWTWIDFRAAAPKSDPPEEIIERGKAVTVKNWSIPYLIGDRRGAIEGITEFLPLAELRARADGGGSGSGGRSKLPLYAGIGLGVAVLGGGGWLITSNRRRRPAA